MSLTLDGQREVPFNPLNLTLDQQQHCQDLSYQLLDRTLRSYDERDASRDAITGSPRHHANLDSTRWKQLRTQTNASLYSERTRATCTPRDLHLPGDNWDNPCVLLAVGSIESNLSEVMFGLETPDFLAMQVRSETLVDVYIQMYVEPQGRLMDKLVIAAMWESTLGFWNAPQVSETKKLQWCIESKSVKRREQASALAHSDTVESSACENCLKKRSMLSRRRSTHLNDDNICALCATPLCSSCRVRKTLKLPGEDRAKLLDVEVAVCQACILFAQKQCPATIATHNQKQRQAVSERSRSASWRLTQESMWDQPTFSPLGSAIRYPSISMSDLVKLINPESMQPAGYPWDRTSG
ncbi:hypothetical protein PI126_g10467 [Phytophthora idaei]|nr:hypothetical protein PI126_g10467 [Phytophthora idaei]